MRSCLISSESSSGKPFAKPGLEFTVILKPSHELCVFIFLSCARAFTFSLKVAWFCMPLVMTMDKIFSVIDFFDFLQLWKHLLVTQVQLEGLRRNFAEVFEYFLFGHFFGGPSSSFVAYMAATGHCCFPYPRCLQWELTLRSLVDCGRLLRCFFLLVVVDPPQMCLP